MSVRTARVVHRLPRYSGKPRLALSVGPGPQRLCLVSTAGEVIACSLDDEPDVWSCWLDSPLQSVTMVGNDRVVGIDQSQRLVSLRLVAPRIGRMA